MAFQSLFRGLTLEASGALGQFIAVRVDSNGQAELPGAGDPIDGVTQETALVQGDAVGIAFDGVSKVTAGATVTVGDLVQSNGVGKAITAGSATHAFGRALTGGLVDELISVLMLPYGELP